MLLGVGLAMTVTAVLTAGAGCGGAVAAWAALSKIAAGTAIGTAVSLAIGGVAAGIQSAQTGHGFWQGFSSSVQDNFLDALLMSFAVTAVAVAIESVARAIVNKLEMNAWYNERALEFTNSGTTNEVVLGRSTDSYHLIAKEMNATYFHTSDVRWAQVENLVGRKGMWKINKAFLKHQIAQGRIFILVSEPVKYGFYGKEIAYLTKLGLL